MSGLHSCLANVANHKSSRAKEREREKQVIYIQINVLCFRLPELYINNISNSMRMCVDFETFHLSEFIPLEFNLRSKKNQTINEISSRPNDSDFCYTHQWPPYLKKNYSINLNARPSILHYTSDTPLRYGRKVTHVVLFFGSPLRAARGFSLTRVYAFFIKGHFSYFEHVQEKRGKYSLFSFFFLLASV